MTIRIGINPISWCNDDLPSLGGDTTLDTILSEGAQIGFEGFELGNKFPKDASELKAVLGKYKVACVSGWYSGNLAQGDLADEFVACIAHMSKLQTQGCKVVVYGEVAGSVQGQIDTPLFKRPRFLNGQEWARYGEKLNQFGAHIKSQYGLTLAYHHHMGAYVEAPSEIDLLMQHTDKNSISLLFDSGHCYFGAAANKEAVRPLDVLKKHSARVVHVHCKDVRADVVAASLNQQWSFLQSVLQGAFTVPGDGAIDFAPLIGVLREKSYAGWLVVEAEQDPALAPPVEYATKGYQTLRALI